MRTIARAISSELGYLNLWDDSSSISEEHLFDGGYIIGTSLDNGPGVNIRTVKDLSANGHNIYLVLVGCSATEIEQQLLERNNAKKLLGLASGWRKIIYKELIEIPRERFFTNESASAASPTEIGQVQSCEELSKLFQALEKDKNSTNKARKTGVFIFFPSIPGSGKSSLCEVFKPHLLNCETECYEKLKDREIAVKVADNTKGKYYLQASREKCLKPSSIYVRAIRNLIVFFNNVMINKSLPV